MLQKLDLKSNLGKDMFYLFSEQEKVHSQFVFHITNLLSNITRFGDFIYFNQNLDCFMGVEIDRHLEFRVLYNTCLNASLYLARVS